MEHNVHAIDGITMQDPSSPDPVGPTVLEDLINAIDSITRKALLEAAAKEDNEDA